MREMSKRQLLAFLPKVRAAVHLKISGDRREGSRYAAVASEGYAGGYAAALDDIEAVLRHGYPGDTWGFWREAHAAPPAPRERSEPPKGFGELPPIEPCEGFRMPTEKEMREGFGPNFNPHRDSPRDRSEHGTDEKEGTGQ